MDATSIQSTKPSSHLDTTVRNAELAQARHRAGQAALENAKAAEARQADQRAEARAIIQRAIGANTRLSIAQNEYGDTYVYRAVDRASGEIVKEWPPVQFAQFLNELGVGNLSKDVLPGMLVNEQA